MQRPTGSMRTIIFSAIAGLLAVSMLVPSIAQPSTLTITQLGALTSTGRAFPNSLKTGTEYWGVGMIQNLGSFAVSFSWSMTLDGTQISYGAWTSEPGTFALLTSISSTTAVPGTHTLSLTLNSGSVILAQATASISVR